ncbi:hypothetical protein SUGI_0318820 [Cryptomeria japonica]|nr:hypothetical protein SUGI_0318820 [Cryptomeria japonica]
MGKTQENPVQKNLNLMDQDEVVVEIQSKEVGITKRCMTNKCRIRSPQIAEKITVPEKLHELEDLSDVLTWDSWNKYLSASERCDLRILLPQGQRNNCVIKSLLDGEIQRFGKNPVAEWGKSVCKEEESPVQILQKEENLKASQSQYLKNLRTYHHEYIDRVEGFKKIFESCNCDDEEFRMVLMKMK